MTTGIMILRYTSRPEMLPTYPKVGPRPLPLLPWRSISLPRHQCLPLFDRGIVLTLLTIPNILTLLIIVHVLILAAI